MLATFRWFLVITSISGRSLDEQLKDLEAKIADADPATQQLFRQSTAVWLQQQQQQQQQQSEQQQQRQPPS